MRVRTWVRGPYKELKGEKGLLAPSQHAFEGRFWVLFGYNFTAPMGVSAKLAALTSALGPYGHVRPGRAAETPGFAFYGVQIFNTFFKIAPREGRQTFGIGGARRRPCPTDGGNRTQLPGTAAFVFASPLSRSICAFRSLLWPSLPRRRRR